MRSSVFALVLFGNLKTNWISSSDNTKMWQLCLKSCTEVGWTFSDPISPEVSIVFLIIYLYIFAHWACWEGAPIKHNE